MSLTCIERKYKVVGNGFIYYITAKRELNEELTKKLLHEDMELKTFLTYYEVSILQKEDSVYTDCSYGIIDLNGNKTDINSIICDTVNKEISVDIKKEISEFRAPPPSITREEMILNNMPKEFALKDIVDLFMSKNRFYDKKRVKERFSSTLQKLKNNKKIEIINPMDNRKDRRYRILIDQTHQDRKLWEHEENQKFF